MGEHSPVKVLGLREAGVVTPPKNSFGLTRLIEQSSFCKGSAAYQGVPCSNNSSRSERVGRGEGIERGLSNGSIFDGEPKRGATGYARRAA